MKFVIKTIRRIIASPLSSSQEKGIFQGFHLPALYKAVLTHLSTKLKTNCQQNVKTKQMTSSRFSCVVVLQEWEVFLHI